MSDQIERNARQMAKELYDGGMGCNCDLDNWQPERTTGHSCVCRIHKRAIAMHLESVRAAAAVGEKNA